MKRYSLYYTKEAKKALKKLDKPILVMVKAWIEKNLTNTDDPQKIWQGSKREILWILALSCRQLPTYLRNP